MADYTAEDVAKLQGDLGKQTYTADDVLAMQSGKPASVGPEPRGLIGETAAGFKRGGLQLVDMAGNIARAVDPEGGIDVVRNAGFGMSKFAKERALQPDVAESSYVKEHPILGNIPKAAEMVIPSVGIPLAIGVGSAAAGLTGPAAAAAGIIGSGAAFGVSQFQDTKERGIEKGLTPEDATTAGIKTGLSEGGGEALSNVLPAAKLFKLGKPVAGQVIKSLFGAPTFKAAAKALTYDAAQIMAGEVSTEMAQAYTQGLTEKNAGIRPDADPWQEAKDVIGPTIALSLMLGGAVGGANKLSKIATQRALTSPNVGEDVRRQAVDNVYSGLVAAEADNQAPVGSAENFKINALEAIKNKEPLVLSDELLTPATPKVVVTQEEAAANVLANLAEGMSPSEAIEEHNAEVVSTKNDVEEAKVEEANKALADQLNLPEAVAPTPEPAPLAPQVPELPTQDTFTRPDNIAPTGEVLDEPVMTDPLEALKGYKTKEAAYKELKKSGRMETHETVERSDGMVVIVPKESKALEPEAPPTHTLTKSGNPFKTEAAARSRVPATHDVVPYEGGWAGVPKQEVTTTPEKTTFTEDEQQHFLNGIPSQYRDAQGRAELLGIVDTNIARLKDEIEFEDVGSEKIDALQTSLNNLYQTKAMLESFEEKGVGDGKQRRAVPDEQGIQEAAPMEETPTNTGGLRDVDGVSRGASINVDRAPVLPGNGTSRKADSKRGSQSRPNVEILKGSQDTTQTGTKPDLGKTVFLALDKPSYGSMKLTKIQEEAFTRAMDRNIAQRVGADTGVKKSALATLRRAVKQLTDDKISPNMFAMEVESALLSVEERRAAASAKGGERVRGADYIRQKLLEAKRRGDITQKAADFAEWFIMKNPKLYNDLGIGIRNIEGAAGRYVPFERLMTLAKGKDGSLTAVHEMFHHLERMMPPALQNTIRKEWLNAVAKEFAAEQKKDANSERTGFLEAVLVNQINGTQLDQNKYVELFNASTLHASDYKYLNASEFWAEKMTTRADAMYAASSLQGKIKVWLKEAWQHIKATLGLDSDSKLYKAMDSIIKGDGKFLSDQMLSKTEQDGFASSLFDPKEQASALKEWYDKSALRSLQDAANKVYRYIMPVDRVITLAMSQADYKPIRSLLGQIQKQKQAKSGYIQSAMDSGYYGIQDIKKHFKSKEELQALSDLAFKATIYELHADPAQAKEWTAKSWEESGQLERTGKTLGQAQKEISDIYAKFTKEQKTAHRTMLDQVQKMYLDGREASLAPWVNKFGRDMVKQAEAYNETYAEAKNKSYKDKTDMVEPVASQDVKDLAAIVANIDLKYPMLKGDYMPLMRFGEYTVRTFDMGENGEVGKRTRMEMFDTQQEALDYVEMINGNPSKTQHAVIEKNVQVTRESVNIPANLIDKLRSLAERQFAKQYPNASPEEAREHAQTIEKLISDAEELRINMMPRVSTAGNKLHREGIEGYSTNLYKVYASYVSNHANANAGLIYGTKIEQTFRDMSNAVKAYTSERGYDPKAAVRMDNLQKTLYKEELESKKIRLNEFVKGTGKLSFFWYLSSPSIWMVQWSQPFMITVPKLAAKFGYGTALKAYSLAAKRYLHGDFSDEKINDFNRTHEFVGDEIYRRIEQSRDATPQERTKLEREIKSLFDGYKNEADRRLIVLKVLSLQGNIDLSASHSFRELAEASNKGDRLVDKVSSGTNFVLDKSSFFMRHSETGSRRAAAVASFELAYKREGFIGANDYAGAIINDTLYDMSSGNRGTAWRGNTGHILGQFQFFRMHTLGKMIQLAKDAMGGEYKRAIAEAKGDKKLIEAAETARSEARKELAYMVGTSFALAGAAGTPIALALGNTATTAIFSALSYMFGDPDDPWDFQREFENAVREAMGETAGNVVLKGLPSLVGADISRRIGLGGMGDVINGDPPAGATGTAKANWYAGRLLGPAWGMVSDQMRAIDALADGNLADAAKFSTPKGVRDLIKTAEVADKGVTGGGKTILQPDDVGMYSMALMMVGINPLDVSLAQEESRYIKNLSTEMSHRRSMLIKGLATATVNGNVDAKEEKIEAINAWSAKNPKLRITAQELAQGVKKVRDGQAGKLTKREMLIKERAEQ